MVRQQRISNNLTTKFVKEKAITWSNNGGSKKKNQGWKFYNKYDILTVEETQIYLI